MGAEIERFERADGFVLCDDRARLDREFILDFLENSYWAGDRNRELNWRAIEGSFAYGLYTAHGAQAGFVRVISDLAKFAWIGDLFVVPGFRGRGLAKWIMHTLLHHSRFRVIGDWQLSTRDAQGLYERFGFQVFEGQGRFMTMSRTDRD